MLILVGGEDHSDLVRGAEHPGGGGLNQVDIAVRPSGDVADTVNAGGAIAIPRSTMASPDCREPSVNS